MGPGPLLRQGTGPSFFLLSAARFVQNPQSRKRKPASRTGSGASELLTNYLYVASVRANSSRCALESVMEPNAGPFRGFAFKVSLRASLTLSSPSALDAI